MSTLKFTVRHGTAHGAGCQPGTLASRMSTSAPSLRRAWARPRHAMPAGGLGTIALASLGLALLSLLLPSTPTYDPYAWLIWGREILHLDLDTEFGPSWKPLPVLFTTVFSLVPSAAPDLWVAVARAGAIASLLLCVRIVWRLGGGLAGGLVAAACLAVSTGYLRFAVIGDSEGLLVALLLAAVDQHLSGRRRVALWLAFGACLLRPEAWPFAGVYAIWLWRAEPALRRTTIGMVVGGIVLWFGPELWGSGDALRAGKRAQDPNPNAIAFADFPAWEAIKRTVSMTPWPAKLGFLVVVAGWISGRWRDRRVGLIALAALLWTLEVAIMTERGFSGNARYMIAPVALACLAGGLGWAKAFALAGRLLAPRAGRAAAAAATVVALVVAAALLLAPADRLPGDWRSARDEAHLMEALDRAIAAAGGPARVRACGSITTGPFQVTPLAWKLDVHIRRVDLVPTVPGTVFRSGPMPRSIPGAPPITVGDPRWRPAAHVDPWEVLQTCRA